MRPIYSDTVRQLVKRFWKTPLILTIYSDSLQWPPSWKSDPSNEYRCYPFAFMSIVSPS